VVLKKLLTIVENNKTSVVKIIVGLPTTIKLQGGVSIMDNSSLAHSKWNCKYMLVSIPPKLSVTQFMGYLKGKSSLMIFDRHAKLKYKYGNRQFCCKGYYVDTVGRNKKVIEEYIKNQIKEDLAYKQLTLKEYVDPFTGKVVKNSKIKYLLSAAGKSDAVGKTFNVRVVPTSNKGF